jgi:solute:Na+ symporter, SSS family
MAYAGENAYQLLEDAYAVTLTGLFVPMMFGCSLSRAAACQALVSMTVGVGLWLFHFVMGYAAGWEYFLEGVDVIGSWRCPRLLTATAWRPCPI